MPCDFLAGWHPKELRLNRLWDTEYTSSYVMHDPEYAARTATLNAVATPAVGEESEQQNIL
jgi:hypothetical protein